MRKVVLLLSVSLDGFFEGPGHDIRWSMVDEELHRHFNDLLRGFGGFLSGRVTWELMASVWPAAGQDPSNPAWMREFAGIWCNMPKVVYSRTLERAGWNTALARAVVPAEVMALKAQPGGDLTVGGPNLAASFMRHDLIDEYRIYVHPVLIGRGRRVFEGAQAPQALRLVETRAFGNGVVLLRHARAGQ
jgi:dihydrofolate reductase